MDKTVKAIVIRATDYKENDRVLTLFGEKGRFRAVIKGVKKLKAKLKFAAQVFNYGEYSLAERNGYFVVTNCSQINGFYELSYLTESYYAAAVAAELSDVAYVADDTSALLAEVLKFYTYLRENEGNTDALLLVFLDNYLKFSGYSFDTSELKETEKAVLAEALKGYGVAFEMKRQAEIKNIIFMYEKQIRDNVSDVKNINAYLKL